MAMAERRPSVPIAVAVVLVVITIALTVGWQILVARETGAFLEGFAPVHWALVIVGSLFFAAIITATILLAAWLVREIRDNQRQRNFIDAVTHELHTPLASLRLYLETLQGQDLSDEKRDEFLGVMTDDLLRLQRTIDQILNAARSEVRRSPREPINLLELLDECVLEARERHDLSDEDVRLEQPTSALVRGDREQLRLAFRNLIENAIHYAGTRIRVDVKVRAVSLRRVEVEVADQGVGIPPSALGRIFLRFQRLSPDAFTTRGGLGLGLYIVRNVVRAHGGSVRAESEGPGSGSRFIVTLPGQLGRFDEHATPAG